MATTDTLSERKALKYHGRLVAALREMAKSAEHHADQCDGVSIDGIREAAALLREIEEDQG